MANKGIIVSDQASGESIACIDARENDNDGNARIIQQFSEIPSPASGIQGIQTGTPLRTLDFGTSGPKGAAGRGDFDQVTGGLNSTETPSGITSNLLDVSDKSAFVLYFTIDYSTDDISPYIQCVPLAFIDDASEVAFCFPPALIRVPYEKFASGTSSNIFVVDEDVAHWANSLLYSDYVNKKFVSIPLVYPTYGLKKVGISLLADVDNSHIVDVFGYTLSGASADAALSNAVHQSRMLATAFLPGGVSAT